MFRNRPLPTPARRSGPACARLATTLTTPLILGLLMLDLVGCATVSVDPPADAEIGAVEETAPRDVSAGSPEPIADTTAAETSPAPPSSDTQPVTVEPTDLPVPGDARPLGPAAATGFVDRLRESFRLDHALHRDGVIREIDRVARRPERLVRRDLMLEYLPYVCGRVWDRGLPGEICLLPIVESRLDPLALSKGGAVGLWQFIPSTARRFGLKIDWWVDERRDVVLATEAALDYLEELHGIFGDWLLALAAYNWGEGSVGRSLLRAGPDAGFFDIRVPRETARYMDRLLAYSAIFADPERFGAELALSELETTSIPFAVVDTPGQLDLARAAGALGCDLDEIYRRNPALNRWATHPDGPHRLVVSADNEAAAKRALAAIPEQERLAWARHLVVPGDTLGEVAAAYRTDVETLRKVNRLRGTVIRVGDHLVVPGRHRSLDDDLDFRRLAGTPGNIYVVKPGDTIWDIARMLRVTRDALMAANHIEPNALLRIGQRLSIPD